MSIFLDYVAWYPDGYISFERKRNSLLIRRHHGLMNDLERRKVLIINS